MFTHSRWLTVVYPTGDKSTHSTKHRSNNFIRSVSSRGVGHWPNLKDKLLERLAVSSQANEVSNLLIPLMPTGRADISRLSRRASNKKAKKLSGLRNCGRWLPLLPGFFVRSAEKSDKGGKFH